MSIVCEKMRSGTLVPCAGVFFFFTGRPEKVYESLDIDSDIQALVRHFVSLK